MPFKAVNSGKICFNKPVFSNNRNPREGFLLSKILFSSVTIRSLVMIFILSQFFAIACNDLSSMVNSSCDANRTARIIRNGSSL